MPAILKTVPKNDWEILQKYIDDDGVILVPEEFYNDLPSDTQSKLVEAAKRYDFGGEADIMVDLVTSENHYIFIEAGVHSEDEE